MQEERRLLLRVGDPATVPIHNSCRDAMRTLPSLVVQRCVSFAGSCELSVGGRVLVGGCGWRSRSLVMSGLLPPLSSRTSGGVSPYLLLCVA